MKRWNVRLIQVELFYTPDMMIKKELKDLSPSLRERISRQGAVHHQIIYIICVTRKEFDQWEDIKSRALYWHPSSE